MPKRMDYRYTVCHGENRNPMRFFPLGDLLGAESSSWKV